MDDDVSQSIGPGDAAAPGAAAPLAPARVRRGGRTLHRVVVVLAVVLPATLWGVVTASADASLGPHLARYEVTVDHAVTVDLGPLGTLVIDSPLPAVLGIRVVVEEIPREVTAVGASATLDALGRDLQGYTQFFSSPQTTVDQVTRLLVLDAARRSALATGLLTLAILGLRAALGPARRAELGAVLGPREDLVVGGVVVTLLLAVTLGGSAPRHGATEVSREASAVFDGTPLEGARLTGRLAGVIDTYGGYVVDAYRSNEDFYAAAAGNVRTAWEDRAAADEDLAARREALARLAAGDPTDERGGRPDAAPTAEPEDVDERPEPVVLLVVSDLHCNVGMARVIRQVAELSGATVVLNAGDSTVNGTGVESYCVQTFADAVPEGADLVIADGNHDSAETAAQERAAGAEVLDGTVVEVQGLRILGDSDPNATRIGVGTRSAGDESVPEAAERLADVACDDPEGVDLLLVHTPPVGVAALERGCVPAQVSGHLHTRWGPTAVGLGVRYISSSTAGATLDQPTVGPLNGVAEMTVLRFDPQERRLLDYRLVRVRPDAGVDVGLALTWPTARTAADARPGDGGSGAGRPQSAGPQPSGVPW